jgi:hypothetical protein
LQSELALEAFSLLFSRLNRQESLTQSLRAELDHLRNLVTLNTSQTGSTEHRLPLASTSQSTRIHPYQSSEPSSHVISPSYPPHDQRGFSDADRVRHDVRVSAIEELEQGHIPTNTLGDGARMLGMLSTARDIPTSSRKRKHGGEMEDAKIAYAV